MNEEQVQGGAGNESNELDRSEFFAASNYGQFSNFNPNNYEHYED